MAKDAGANPKGKLQAILIIAGIGWANLLYALSHRQTLLSEGLEKPSFCNVSSAINCDSVALSDYSALLGFPTAAWGMLFCAAMMLLSIWGFFAAQDNDQEKSSASSTLLFGLSLAGLVPTVALAAISAVVVKSLCLMCLVTYVVNIALFAIAWKLPGRIGLGAALRKVPQALWILLVVIAGLHALAPKMVEGSGSRMDEGLLRSIVASHFLEPVRNLNLENTPILGPKDAPITIVEFSDMQCPFCARAALTLPNVAQAYPGKVRIAFKHYPLDPACNPGMKNGGHPKACLAAKAGHCVFKAKGDEAFFRFTEELFKKQTQIGESLIEEMAAKEGLDKATLMACVNESATHDTILANVTEGNAADVKATPTIYINGRKSEYGTVPKVLTELLKGHIAQLPK